MDRNIFLMSGTLGDAFIVFLKLYKYYRKKKIVLKRISMWPNQDKVISQLAKFFPYIKYSSPCIKINHINETKYIITKKKNNYVNTSWNGKYFSDFCEKDFRKLSVTPFPIVNIKKKISKTKKIIVVIQLNSGKLGGNLKIFSSLWIIRLINCFNSNKYIFYIVGTSDFKTDILQKKFDLKENVKFLVNKTNFIEWLTIIKSANFFISNEGFPAFFAMSQRVNSICFYTDKRILSRVHPKWKKKNLILDVGWNSIFSSLKVIFTRIFFNRYPLIYPTKPENIYKYILKKHKAL